MQTVEKWDVFEVSVIGKQDGNPYTDYTILATFEGPGECLSIDGFYDGGGIYKVRFMPGSEGMYTYHIKGSFSDKEIDGSFMAIAPGMENHGPVKVVHQTYFAYADGTPYYPVGTTCYAWVFQEPEVQEQTLRTLEMGFFNKLRFCVYPKSYLYNLKEPMHYPYERGNGEGLDRALVEKFSRERMQFPVIDVKEDFSFNYHAFNPEYFKLLDQRISQLMKLGIEADLILMHPYDRWGHVSIDIQGCALYLRYMAARYSAYRNLWWSLANEYDLIPTRSQKDWDDFGQLLREKDPWQHLISIHNFREYYDYTKPWITHCCMQQTDTYKPTEATEKYLEVYKKPVVWDEIGYEGNMSESFGNMSAQELVRHCWEAALRGGYGCHSETYVGDTIWWSHGGVLAGESPKRLKFLQEILKEVPGNYLKLDTQVYGKIVGIPYNEFREDIMSPPCSYELHYLGLAQPAYYDLYLPEDEAYEVNIIDTWQMTIEAAGTFRGKTVLRLPQRPYIAVRLKRRINL